MKQKSSVFRWRHALDRTGFAGEGARYGAAARESPAVEFNKTEKVGWMLLDKVMCLVMRAAYDYE